MAINRFISHLILLFFYYLLLMFEFKNKLLNAFVNITTSYKLKNKFSKHQKFILKKIQTNFNN